MLQSKDPVSVHEAQTIDLMRCEVHHALLSLAQCSVPVIMMRLPKADPMLLQTSLAKALAVHPIFAGRLKVDVRTGQGQAKLTNQGVPFTVIQVAESGAPLVLTEEILLELSDVRNPRSISRGIEPAMTVKLAIYQDGSSILSLARSHGIADGTYIWTFISTWASAARGEALHGPVNEDRTPVLKHNKWGDDAEKMQQFFEEMLGHRVSRMVGAQYIMMRGIQASDLNFFAGKFNSRKHVFFSHEMLARIKQAATPAPGSEGDGWVTTQEALGAHVFLALARVILPWKKKRLNPPLSMIGFLLDIRKMFGLPASQPSGSAFIKFEVVVEDPLGKSLPEVATSIHKEIRDLTLEKVEKQWALAEAASDHGLLTELIMVRGAKRTYMELILELNNQTNRVYPDFGQAGGVPTHVLTNAGPSLLYKAEGGFDLFLANESFMGAPPEKVLQAISEMP